MKRAGPNIDGACPNKRQRVGNHSGLRGVIFHAANAQRSARRGLAYVWLHFVYEPFVYRRRVQAAHEFLAGRSRSELISDVEDAVHVAGAKPFRALLREDFWQQDCTIETRDALLQRRLLLRAELELQLQRQLWKEANNTGFSLFSGVCSFRLRVDPKQRHYFGKVPLEVKRGAVFDSAVESILAARPSHLLSGIHVRFHEISGFAEAGVDSGGLTREFFELVVKDLSDVSRASTPSTPSRRLRRSVSVEGIGEPMFSQQADGSLMLASSSRPPAVYFALGRLVGVALVHASYGDSALPLPLSDCLLKCMVGAPITAADVRKRDPIYYKNRIEAVLSTEGRRMVTAALMEEKLVFAERGRDLKPGGGTEEVTDGNVMEYVTLLSEDYVCGDVRTEISEFLAGFHDIVPRKLLQQATLQASVRSIDIPSCWMQESKSKLENNLDVQPVSACIGSCSSQKSSMSFFPGAMQVGLSWVHLGNLLSGVDYIDVETWRRHAQVRAAGVNKEEALRVTNIFWHILAHWPAVEQSAVLAFASGCSRLPACGFERLDPPFTVEVVPRSGKLPTSHTCFNTITLPAYEEVLLEQKLAFAIHECSSGFAFI